MNIKNVTLSFIVMLVSLSLFAQRTYNVAIQDGDAAYNRAEYTTAIKNYLSAMEIEPNRWRDVNAKLENVYKKINEVQRELAQTKTALESTKQNLAATTNQKTQSNSSLQSELTQAKKDLDTSKQELKAVTEQKNNLKTELEQANNKLKESPKEVQQQKAFIELVPLLTQKNAQKVCKELDLKPDKKNFTQSIVDDFFKTEDKDELIKKINSILK